MKIRQGTVQRGYRRKESNICTEGREDREEERNIYNKIELQYKKDERIENKRK